MNSFLNKIVSMIREQDNSAGIEDTDYPYFHVSDHPEKPTVHYGGQHKDPAGIYLFYKGIPVDQTDWKPKKYRWDAKIKPGANILDVNRFAWNEILAEIGIEDFDDYIYNLDLREDHGMDLAAIQDYYEIWKDEKEDDEDMRADVAWALLRNHFNDQKKFTSFLKSKGIDAIEDDSGDVIFYGEPQMIVINPSVIEWGPKEENVTDPKVYQLN